jgi:hypothetical protein
MALFQQVNYHADTQTVDIGPGRLWQDIYRILPPDRTVAGASSCAGVGVAGFNLGGGYSNKTNQFGLAIDNIQSIDVVVPSGEVLKVCETSNEDLFWALKVCTLSSVITEHSLTQHQGRRKQFWYSDELDHDNTSTRLHICTPQGNFSMIYMLLN